MSINLQGEWILINPKRIWGKNTLSCVDVFCE